MFRRVLTGVTPSAGAAFGAQPEQRFARIVKFPVKKGNFSGLQALNDSSGWVVLAGQLMVVTHRGPCSTMPGQGVLWRGLGYEPARN